MSEETPQDVAAAVDPTADDESLPEGWTAEAEPAPLPEYPLFKCRHGHVQRGSGATILSNPEFGSISSGPVCTQCWWTWLGRKFRTEEVKNG